jgi:hypothetical protein
MLVTLELFAQADPISFGSSWKYLDNGSNQGTVWRGISFDDATWKTGNGKFGYGITDAATAVSYGSNPDYKYITTYFRKSISITNPNTYTSYTASVKRDDGIVVYVNGVEVYRNNLPTGTISYTTLASSATDNGTTVQNFNIKSSAFVSGTNVIAVEIHQRSGSTSDMAFDLSLRQPVIDNPSPANGAYSSPTSTTLCATVSGPNNTLRVRYYGRKKATTTGKFTIIMLPDTQFYTSEKHGGNNKMFKAQTNWIANNRAAKNIVYVGQLGDCTENGDAYEVQWKRADTAIKTIENPTLTGLTQGVPYGICVGNHDQTPLASANGTTTFYNKYFGSSRFTGRSYYGGHSGTNNDNHYQLLSAGGIDFLVICPEYDQSTGFSASGGALSWAENLVKSYPNRKVIVLSHYVANGDASFSTQGLALYNRLKVYSNFILMIGGHHTANTGESRRSDTYNGRTVHTVAL